MKSLLENPTDDFGNMFIDPDFADIVSSIIGDINLWHTLINGASSLICYKTNSNYKESFEEFFNDINCVPAPTRIEYNEIIEKTISKALIKSFNNYIEEKLGK